MHYFEVSPNCIVRSDSEFFTYSFVEPLEVGQIVLIEVGKKQLVGVVLREVSKPTFATKQITSIIEGKPLPKPLVSLAEWISRYYITPLGLVWQTVLPSGLQKTHRSTAAQTHKPTRKRTNNVLNNEQSSAVETIKQYNNGTFLLHGITGSGKTEVYIDIIRDTLLQGKSCIVLVPEIALTSQLVAEFSNHFNNLVVTHSKMTPANRYKVWKQMLDTDDPFVILGARSAIFAPLKNLGVIIVDEIHEPSFKQDQNPKYSALRAATMLGRFHAAKVIFGSATPSVVDRYLAEEAKRPILTLTKPAREYTSPATVSLIDMRVRTNFKSHRFLSDILINKIDKTLENNNQSLIFHNRRGSANSTLCESCGWTANCPHCYLPLTLHSDKHTLRCHICNFDMNIPTSCPKCNNADIIHKGMGTKLIESEIKKLFPKATVARFDADNISSETLENRYQELYDNHVDIIIGTQVVAKGLDLPNLRTVGIIQADVGLSLPDYSAGERVFQLIAQTVGRVGRDKYHTDVVVQSFQPTHPSIVFGMNQDYESFYTKTLIERQKALFPPFKYLLKLTCTYKTEAGAIKNSQSFARLLSQKLGTKIRILGPAPSFYERSNGSFRWQLIIKSSKREYLIETLEISTYCKLAIRS